MARTAAGLRQADVAAAAGLSDSELSRIELGDAPWLSFEVAGRLCAIVGLDLWARAYPGGNPVRDAAHLRLLAALQRALGPGLSLRAEVPSGGPGDLRSWDAIVESRRGRMPAELETRLTDGQALARRLAAKLRDTTVALSGHGLILVLADTRSNRAAYTTASHTLETVAAAPPEEIRDALRLGRVPARGGVLFLSTRRQAD